MLKNNEHTDISFFARCSFSSSWLRHLKRLAASLAIQQDLEHLALSHSEPDTYIGVFWPYIRVIHERNAKLLDERQIPIWGLVGEGGDDYAVLCVVFPWLLLNTENDGV